MNISELARGLNLSRQMIYRLKQRGMPIDTLQGAKEWRYQNLHPFQTKSGRLLGNSGKPYRSTQDAIEATLEKTVPELYFQRVDWLASAFNEVGIIANGAQLIEVQDFLYATYLEEIAYKLSKSKTSYPLPPMFAGMLDSKERQDLIESIDKMLTN